MPIHTKDNQYFIMEHHSVQIHCTCQSLQVGPPKDCKEHTLIIPYTKWDRLHLHLNHISNTDIIYGLQFIDNYGCGEIDFYVT